MSYVRIPDEGHGFNIPINNWALFGIVEKFLQDCLGGRAEPMDLYGSGSKIQIVDAGEMTELQ